MNTKLLLLIASLVAAVPGSQFLLDQIAPQAEYSSAYITVNSTVENAIGITQITPEVSQEEALKRAVEENHKAEDLTTDGTYVYYTVGNTCLKGSIKLDYSVVEKC